MGFDRNGRHHEAGRENDAERRGRAIFEPQRLSHSRETNLRQLPYAELKRLEMVEWKLNIKY